MLRASDLRNSRQACRSDGAMVHVQACLCWRSWSTRAPRGKVLMGTADAESVRPVTQQTHLPQ